MNTLQAQWESYAKNVLPKNASSTQVVETRRAFYAGSKAMIYLIDSINAPHISEQAGYKMMDNIELELETFVKDVSAGKA